MVDHRDLGRDHRRVVGLTVQVPSLIWRVSRNSQAMKISAEVMFSAASVMARRCTLGEAKLVGEQDQRPVLLERVREPAARRVGSASWPSCIVPTSGQSRRSEKSDGEGLAMAQFSEHDLTDAVIERLAECDDPRFKTVMTSLIRHLHDFVRDVELTEAEWLTAIRFLTAVGQACTDKRQEFILLSDTLGVSILVDAINHRMPTGAVEIDGARPVVHRRRAGAAARLGHQQRRPRASRPSTPGAS